MKKLSIFINEKLRLTKHIDSNGHVETETRNAFKSYYKGIPERELNRILDNYVFGHPFPKDVENVLTCTPFELLFMLGAMLVADGYEERQITHIYKKIGLKGYRNAAGKQGSNPYDYGWFEEDYKDGDILDYLKDEWIPNNEDEFFVDIYSICRDYHNILTIDSIENFCDSVLDKEY